MFLMYDEATVASLLPVNNNTEVVSNYIATLRYSTQLSTNYVFTMYAIVNLQIAGYK